MILQINTSLCKMDSSLLEASADLGANKLQTFLRVTFPLSLSGVISWIALVFLPAVSSFFIPKLLGGGQFFLIGNVIENQFITVGEWNFGSAISMIMAVIMMLWMYLIRRVDEHNNGGRQKKAWKKKNAFLVKCWWCFLYCSSTFRFYIWSYFLSIQDDLWRILKVSVFAGMSTCYKIVTWWNHFIQRLRLLC